MIQAGSRPEAARLRGTCPLAGCERPSRSDGTLCAMHERRRSRGEPLGAPVRERLDPLPNLLARAIEYGDAASEDDLAYHLARERLLAAARRFVREEERQRTAATEAADVLEVVA